MESNPEESAVNDEDDSEVDSVPSVTDLLLAALPHIGAAVAKSSADTDGPVVAIKAPPPELAKAVISGGEVQAYFRDFGYNEDELDDEAAGAFAHAINILALEDEEAIDDIDDDDDDDEDSVNLVQVSRRGSLRRSSTISTDVKNMSAQAALINAKEVSSSNVSQSRRASATLNRSALLPGSRKSSFAAEISVASEASASPPSLVEATQIRETSDKAASFRGSLSSTSARNQYTSGGDLGFKKKRASPSASSSRRESTTSNRGSRALSQSKVSATASVVLDPVFKAIQPSGPDERQKSADFGTRAAVGENGRLSRRSSLKRSSMLPESSKALFAHGGIANSVPHDNNSRVSLERRASVTFGRTSQIIGQAGKESSLIPAESTATDSARANVQSAAPARSFTDAGVQCTLANARGRPGSAGKSEYSPAFWISTNIVNPHNLRAPEACGCLRGKHDKSLRSPSPASSPWRPLSAPASSAAVTASDPVRRYRYFMRQWEVNPFVHRIVNSKATGFRYGDPLRIKKN